MFKFLKKKELESIFVFPDSHIPYHDRRAMELALKIYEDLQPDYTVIIGDFGDFYAISRYPKNPKMAFRLKYEVSETKKILRRVEVVCQDSKKIFIEGNHEDRLSRYLREKAPELFECVSIPELLELEKWTFVPYGQFYTIGKLNLTHDDGSGGKYAVHKALDSYQDNICIGHGHRGMVVYSGNVKGHTHVGLMCGWLGNVNHEAVKYMKEAARKKDWQLGFSIGYMELNGNVHMQFVPIIGYKAIVNGRLYKN